MSKIPYISRDAISPQWIDEDGCIYEERLTNPVPTFEFVCVGLDLKSVGKDCQPLPDGLDCPVAPEEEE